MDTMDSATGVQSVTFLEKDLISTKLQLEIYHTASDWDQDTMPFQDCQAQYAGYTPECFPSASIVC